MRLTTLSTIFSILFLSSCASIKRPNAELCVVNAPAGHVKCYNMLSDYDAMGTLKKSATPYFGPGKSVYDLNKGVWMSNDDWSRVKVWIGELKRAYEQGKK